MPVRKESGLTRYVTGTNCEKRNRNSWYYNTDRLFLNNEKRKVGAEGQ